MAFVLKDRVRETTSTSGTGAIFPSGVVTGGYRTFNSQLSNGDTTLCLVRNNAGQWQTFLGTWNSATQSMARTTVYDGSEGAGVTVNFSGEQQEIWINYPAEKYEHPQVQDINIGAPYGVNTGVRLFTVYKDQSLSATSSMVFRVGGIARGTLTGPTEGVYGFILDEDRIGQTDPSDGVSLIFNASTMRAGWSGGRTLAMDQLYVGNPAAPGAGSAGTAGDGAYHVAGASFAYSHTDAGGTVGDERGNLFGRNDAVRVRTGSGYHWNSAFGNETDVGVESGNEVNWKGGVKVVQWSTDATRGVIQDFAYGINNQVNGTAPGWRVGFALGGFEGWWPFTSDSTVMKALDGNIGGGPAKAFAAGIDFRGITVGESQFAGPGFMVDGSGDLGAVVASGVALQTRDGITAHTAVVGSITVLEGGLYSGAITLTLSAPQGSGTTATATVATVAIPYIENINTAGTAYAVGDTITLVGGTFTTAAVGLITKVNGTGAVQGIKMTTPGNYSVLPSSPIATTTSGSGTGLTITPKVSILTINAGGTGGTNAGSNYLQFLPPTMTSAGASATYRQALVRVNMTPAAAALNVGNNYANWMTLTGAAGGARPLLSTAGVDAAIPLEITPKGGAPARFGGPILQQYTNSPTTTITPFFRANQTVSGTITGGNAFINDFNALDNLNAVATAGANWMYFGHVYGSSLQGDRATMKVVTDIAARPADSTTGVKYYVGLNGNMTVKVDLSNGGGGYNGNAIGMSYDARVASGGEVSMIEACEMGAGVMAGGSAQLVNVLKLSPLGGAGAGGGTLSYNGLAFSSALGDTGLNVGIAFGGREGTGWPIASTGKLIAITDPAGSPAKTVDYGIDFVSVACTFTTAAFASPGFRVNGSGTTTTTGMILAMRVVTAAGAVTVTATDDIVVVNKTVGAATTVNLPASPATGRRYVIKDGKGDAAANNITITPAAGTIDGAATLVVNTNFGRATIAYNGTQWNQV